MDNITTTITVDTTYFNIKDLTEGCSTLIDCIWVKRLDNCLFARHHNDSVHLATDRDGNLSAKARVTFATMVAYREAMI